MAAASYFRVRNWSRYQHYRDRNPPWIKLHVEIFTSEDWVMLADASKLLALVCMVIAAKHDGRVPNNPHYIKRIAYLDSLPNLKPLIECGFLENTLAEDTETLAAARPEKETEGETEKEEVMSVLQTDAQQIEAPSGTKKAVRTAYPKDFEDFWKAYPTDPNMSKRSANLQWSKLTPDEKIEVIQAIPAFKAYCSKDKTYRPVHAVRFLSEQRFKGFLAEKVIVDPVVAAEQRDKADRMLRRGKYAESEANP